MYKYYFYGIVIRIPVRLAGKLALEETFMFARFQPVTTEPFKLRSFRGEEFEVTVSRKSCFDGFERHTQLPCLHLSVSAADESVTWDKWQWMAGNVHSVERAAEDQIELIIRHFFGSALTLDHAAWRIERNSPRAARRQTVHLHLKIAHVDLWGEDGMIKQCVQTDLKPSITEQGAVQQFRKDTIGRFDSSDPTGHDKI